MSMDVSRWQPSLGTLGTLGTSISHGGSSVANGLSSLTSDRSDREKVSFVTFSHLEYTSSKSDSSGLIRRPVLLIGYTTGFQVWDLGSGAPNVLVSRREGPVRYEKSIIKASLYTRIRLDDWRHRLPCDLDPFWTPESAHARLTHGYVKVWGIHAPVIALPREPRMHR